MSEIIIENLHLKYPLFSEGDNQLRNIINRFVGIEKKKKINIVHALKGINLHLKNGDRLGLVGPNGCGKTTLLKIMGSIYQPTSGNVKINGTIYPLLDIGMGMVGECSGYDNIFLISYARGFSKASVLKSLDWIIEFSGLEDAIYRTVRTYSSGMVVRLACSVILSQTPDIFLIDEFFGAGDKNFQEKVEKKLKENIEKAGIFVFASHSEDLIKRICNKVASFKVPGIIDNVTNI